MAPEQPPLIVTGANHGYARTLMQFLLSAERHGEHRRSDWIIYDLGLSGSDLDALQKHFPWATIRGVDFTRYPPHVDVTAGSFAWKPILLQEAAQMRAGPVFWLDSATVLRRPLDEPLATLRRTGLWTLRGDRPLMSRSDARVIAALGVPPETLHLPERAAGAVGFDTRFTHAQDLLRDWAALARDPQFILPPNPDARHRYDQTLLSALLLTFAWQGKIELGTEEIDLSSVAPVLYLSTRNKLWPSLPLWFDRPARAWYWLWKAGDRIALRWEAFRKSRLEGLLGALREHYRVETGDGRTIPGPRFGYFADPFRLSCRGNSWLFVERLDYVRNKGRIVAINEADGHEVAITGGGLFGKIDCHASFPFLLERDQSLYMIPETSARRTVDLYACTNFPGEWQLRKRLLADVDAADSMLIHKDGTDYLFTSVREGNEQRHLEIHVSPNVMVEPLQPHPVNGQRLYANSSFGTGRCGGFLGFDGGGRLLRFMQRSSRRYGEGGQWMEITDLSAQTFAERPLEDAALPTGFPKRRNSHHLSFSSGQFVWDVRDR